MQHLPAGAVAVFGAGSKLLRGVAVLLDTCVVLLLLPLGASLEGADALGVVCSSFAKLEPAGDQNCPNYKFIKNVCELWHADQACISNYNLQKHIHIATWTKLHGFSPVQIVIQE